MFIRSQDGRMLVPVDKFILTYYKEPMSYDDAFALFNGVEDCINYIFSAFNMSDNSDIIGRYQGEKRVKEVMDDICHWIKTKGFYIKDDGVITNIYQMPKN